MLYKEKERDFASNFAAPPLLFCEVIMKEEDKELEKSSGKSDSSRESAHKDNAHSECVTEEGKTERYVSENETYGGKPKTFKEKLSNFWYHHKWGTIVSTLCVFIAVVLIVQLINQPKIDINIIYAGGHSISRIQKDGMPSEYEDMLESLKNIGTDFDGNGEISVNLLDYYYLTEEEMNNYSDGELDYTRIREDRTNFQSKVQTGDACLMFLSTAIYDELYYEMGSSIKDGQIFFDIGAYVEKSNATGYEYYGEGTKAVYLKSLKFSELPGFSSLPDDTVVCLRTRTVGTIWDNEEDFEKAVIVLKALLDFGY